MAKVKARTEEEDEEEEEMNRSNYSTNLDRRTSFDEECRKIQNGAGLGRSGRVNSRERSWSDVGRQDTDILKQKNKDIDSKIVDQMMEIHKGAQKMISRRGCESCFCHTSDAASSIHKKSTTSAENPSNDTAIAAETTHCKEAFPMSTIRLEKHERVDANMQQPQMSATNFVDQIIGDRKLVSNEVVKFESKPFSKALEVLNSDKDLFIKLLSEPYCLPHNCFKNLQTEREASKPVSGGSNTSLVSFSVREIKRKLKHAFGSRRKEPDHQLPKFRTTKLCHNRSVFGHDCIYSGVEAMNPLSSTNNYRTKEKIGKKQGLKVGRETQTVRKKIDVSSDRLFKKHEVDVSLEARLKDLNAISRIQNPWRVISSLEIDSCLSPRRESQYFSGSAQVSLSPCMSPMRRSKEIEPDDGTTDTLSIETNSSIVSSTDDEEAREEIISSTPNMKFNDLPNVVKSDDAHCTEAPHDTVISNAQRSAKIKLHNQEYGSPTHSIMDSISRTEDDFPSGPTLDNNTRYQEEHQSPISVLDQFFAEDTTSPSDVVFQSARGPLKPRRLYFEEHKLASSSQDTPIRANPCMLDQDYTISNYVRLIFEASSLNWNNLSAIRLLSEHLLHPSLFDQAQLLPFDSHFDTRLLFDRVNELLLETQQSHFVSPYWPAFARPRICCLPLEEAVVNEIMREAEFYLLPQTQRRTLDQLLAKDFSGSRLRPDFRSETEQIIGHISEDILEESVLDVILELHS